MRNENQVKTERVDDIPILIEQAKRMRLPELIEQYFPTHGNRKGLPIGWVTSIWLAYIISESDHRLNQVEKWTSLLSETLNISTGQEVKELDFTDDRLEDVLKYLSDDTKWSLFEAELNRTTIRVYQLEKEPIRIDSTTASGYCAIDENGLFQYGYSKDKRPDLPQLKVNLATLDPMGMPLVTTVLSGETADDSLYIPAVRQSKKSIESDGLLYIGDSKMGSLLNRGFIQAQRDYYLCPLSLVQLSTEEIEPYLENIRRQPQETVSIYKTLADGTQEHIGEGAEYEQTLQTTIDGRPIVWHERHLVIRSFRLRQSAEKGLRTRLDKAKEELEKLNHRGRGKKIFSSKEQLELAAQEILRKYDVEGLFSLVYQQSSTVRNLRRYKDRPAQQVTEIRFFILAEIDQVAFSNALYRLGWRVYATNAPQDRLSISKAALAYRNEFIIERDFGRLKGKSLSLSPVYLERDDLATGLVRLLSIGLRILTLLEFVVRRRLDHERQQLSGLYAGNPKRSTSHPTAEMLLRAFDHISLVVLSETNGVVRRFLTQISHLHLQILSLLGFPVDIYYRLSNNSQVLSSQMSEP